MCMFCGLDTWWESGKCVPLSSEEHKSKVKLNYVSCRVFAHLPTSHNNVLGERMC